MVVKAGGSNFQVGLLTAIMIGTPIIGELLFASYLCLKERKKPFLLLGINLRVLALALVSLILCQAGRYSDSSTIFLIFALMFIFAIPEAALEDNITRIKGLDMQEVRTRFLFLPSTPDIVRVATLQLEKRYWVAFLLSSSGLHFSFFTLIYPNSLKS